MSDQYFNGEAIFSAGGVLVDKENNKALLIYKEKIDEWLLPKGRMEKGETIEQTAEREIFEETGYKNKFEKLLSVQVRPDINDPNKTKVIFWFACVLTDKEKTENTQDVGENFTGKWVSLSEALQLLKWENDKKLVTLSLNSEK